MANEIQAAHYNTGKTLYALVRTTSGTVWQTTTSTFVAYTSANLANYIIPMAEQGVASQYYDGDFPVAPAGTYNVSAYEQQGGSPAEGDKVVAIGNIEWDGAVVVAISSRLPTSSYVIPDNVAITFLKNVLEGDDVIDTLSTPWNRVIFTKGTSTELIRKKLRDTNGGNVIDSNTIIGSSKEL